jgi:hypothetical protein
MRKGPGCCLGKLLWLPAVALFAAGVVYAVAAITSPWAFHIGGRSTPLLIWQGTGTLRTSGGEYPLYVDFYPSPHSSRLRLDGKRPTGGLQGSGWLCTARGVSQRLDLTGTIYGGWRSTENSLMTFRLLEYRLFNNGQYRGYFDLYGKWKGQQLVMDDRGSYSSTFRSGLRVDHASVTFDWGSYSVFKATCAEATNLPASH